MKCPICREGELLPSLGGRPRCDRCGVLDFEAPRASRLALPSLVYAPRSQGEPPTPLDSPIRGAFCLDPFLDAARRGDGRPDAGRGLSSEDVVDLAGEALLARLADLAPDVAARARLEDPAVVLAVPQVVEARPGRKATFHRVLELDLEGTGVKGPGWVLGYTLERKRGELARGPEDEPRLIKSYAEFVEVFGTPGPTYGVPRWGKSEASFDNAVLVQLAAKRLRWVDDGGLSG